MRREGGVTPSGPPPPGGAAGAAGAAGALGVADRFALVVEDTFSALLDRAPVPRAAIEAAVRHREPLWPVGTVAGAVDAVAARFDGYGPLQPLWADPSVAEIMVNGVDVWVERQGRVERTDIRLDPAAAQRLIERLVGPAGARVDRASPIVDVRLPDGSRANVVLSPLALDGPYITIRRFVLATAELSDFAPPEVAALLADAVRRRTNLVVSGGTGSGKTTLLNALAAHVGRDERIVTIEDTAELRLAHPHVVRLEARRANAEGVGEVAIRALVRTALRMRPDRILVGEARGAEVMDVMQAMNSGHEGSMSTCHANSPRDCLRRFEALAMLGEGVFGNDFVRDQISAALQLVVHVERADGGRRRVRDVVAVGPQADWRTGADLHPLVEAGRRCAEPAVPR